MMIERFKKKMKRNYYKPLDRNAAAIDEILKMVNSMSEKLDEVIDEVNKQRKDINECKVINCIADLTIDTSYFIRHKVIEDKGWVLVQGVDEITKEIYCYWLYDGELYDDYLKFDDYTFYNCEV